MKYDHIFIIFLIVLVTVTRNASPLALKGNANKKPWDFSSSKAQNEASQVLCNDGNQTCTLNFKQSDIDYFQRLVLVRNAIIVFIYVTFSNDTEGRQYIGDKNRKVVPFSLKEKEKWAWIRNDKAKFFATLPYNFDILSLDTLTKDVYDLSLNLNSTPSDCYLKLSSKCLQYKVAERIYYFSGVHIGTVCQKIIESTSLIKDHGYDCCHEKGNGTLICNNPIKYNFWVKCAIALLWAIAIAFSLLSPLLLNYLPVEFKKGVRLKRASSRGMKRSDSCSSYEAFEKSVLNNGRQLMISKDNGPLDILRTTIESTVCSRFIRCFFVVLLSLIPILQILLIEYLKESEVGISNQVLGIGSAFSTLLAPTGKYVVIALYCFCIVLVAITVAIPKTLSELARRLSGRNDEKSFLGFKKPPELISHSDERGFQLMYENMIFHLNCLMMLTFWKFVFSVTFYPLHVLCKPYSGSRSILDEEQEEQEEQEEPKPGVCITVLYTILLLIVLPIWAVIILSAFFLYILPVTYVAFRIWKMLFRFETDCTCCQSVPVAIRIISLPVLYMLFIVFCICVEVSYFMLVLEISFNIVFLGSIIGFTTMGVIFYIDVYISYVVVIVLSLYYIAKAVQRFCFRFKRLKDIIFKECEAHDNEVRAEASIRETFSGQTNALERTSSVSSLQKSTKSMVILVSYDEQKIPNISLKLFLMALNELLPFKRVLLGNILGLSVVFVYLMLVFFFVMSLVEFNAANPIVQALAIFLLGVIPAVFQEKTNQINEKAERLMNYRFKDQIKLYCKRFS